MNEESIKPIAAKFFEELENYKNTHDEHDLEDGEFVMVFVGTKMTQGGQSGIGLQVAMLGHGNSMITGLAAVMKEDPQAARVFLYATKGLKKEMKGHKKHLKKMRDLVMRSDLSVEGFVNALKQSTNDPRIKEAIDKAYSQTKKEMAHESES